MEELQQLRNKNDPPFRQTMINSYNNSKNFTNIGLRNLGFKKFRFV